MPKAEFDLNHWCEVVDMMDGIILGHCSHRNRTSGFDSRRSKPNHRVPTGTTITRASTLPSDWKSDGWGLELVEVLEQSAECDFADS